MRKALVLFLATLAAPGLAGAGELELTGYAGYTFPFYSQAFRYDPGPVTVPIPGVTVEQGGSFELKASGGAAFAGGLTFYVTDGFGFEVRYDHADITIETQSSSYDVRVGLPAPLDPVVATLTLTEGTVDLEGGRSLLAEPQAPDAGATSGSPPPEARASWATSRPPCSRRSASASGSSTTSRACSRSGPSRCEPSPRRVSSWGGNLGLGLQIPIGEHAALVLEGRGFYFPKRTLTWEPVLDRPLSDIEQALLARVQERLQPVEFEPWWVQATAGLSIRF